MQLGQARFGDDTGGLFLLKRPRIVQLPGVTFAGIL